MRGFLSGVAAASSNTDTDKARLGLPLLSPPPGTYPADDYPFNVVVTSQETDANLYVTIDGTPPSPSNFLATGIGSATVSLTAPGFTLRAIAIKSGFNESIITGGLYDSPVSPQCSTPSYSPVGGHYNNDQFPKNIVITSATAGSTIHYTTNNTPATSGSPSVANGGTVSVAANQFLRAIATKAAYTDSAEKNSQYIADVYTCNTPTFSPVAGQYGDAGFPKTVVITSAFPSGLSIRYTTDGSAPTTAHGTLIVSGESASVPADATLKAIAYKTAYTNSAVASGFYDSVSIASPTFSPNGGESVYPDGHIDVTIATGTAGCTIRWTSDGSTPTSSHGTLINASSGNAHFTVASGSTVYLRARAFKSGYNQTAVIVSLVYNPYRGG